MARRSRQARPAGACTLSTPADRNLPVTRSPRPQNEPSVAANPLAVRNLIVTANDYTRRPPAIGLYRSCDGGVSFSRTLLPLPRGYRAGSDGVAAAGFPRGSSDPERALFLVAGIALPSPERGGAVVAYRSTDAGASFRGPVVVAQGYGHLVANDKPAVVIDRSPASPRLGYAYIAYTRFVNNEQGTAVFVHRSPDGGRCWSRPRRLSPLRTRAQGVALAVGPAGELYAAWIEFGPGRPRLRLRRSDDGGRSFAPPVTVARVAPPPSPLPVRGWDFRVPTFASLGTDISSGPASAAVYAVWQNDRTRRSRILLARSSDRGRTWTAPADVSRSPRSAQDFFPAIAVSPVTGAIQVIFYTNRLAPERLDVFAAESPPGGSDFSVQRRVTDMSFDPTADPALRRFIGDYIGVAPYGPDGIVAVWTDTRRGNQDIFIGQ